MTPTDTQRAQNGQQCTRYDSNALGRRALHCLPSSAMLRQVVQCHWTTSQHAARCAPYPPQQVLGRADSRGGCYTGYTLSSSSRRCLGVSQFSVLRGRSPRWSLMSKVLGLGVPDPLETYRTSPHLFTDLVIPEGTTGRLPRAKRTRAGLDAEVLEDLGGSAPRSEGRGRGSRSGSRGGLGRSARSGDSSRSSRGSRGSRSRGSQDGDRTLNAGKGGRSDRGTRGRGRGEHSPRSSAEGASGSAGSAPAERASRARKRIRRRKGGE